MKIRLNEHRRQAGLGIAGIIILVIVILVITAWMISLLVGVLKKALPPPPPPDQTSLVAYGDTNVVEEVATNVTIIDATTSQQAASSTEVITKGGTVEILQYLETPQGSMVALGFTPPSTGTPDAMTNWLSFNAVVLASTDPGQSNTVWNEVANVQVNAQDIPEFDVWYEILNYTVIFSTNRSEFYRVRFEPTPP